MKNKYFNLQKIPATINVKHLFTFLLFLGLLTINSHIYAKNNDTPSTDDFVITVKTDNLGLSSDTQFTIFTTGSGYNYNQDCDNDGRVSETPWFGFPRIYFNNGGDKDKILSVDQWGTTKRTSIKKTVSFPTFRLFQSWNIIFNGNANKNCITVIDDVYNEN